ncbi:hypothetical protein CEE37_02225 [candidate division LCP-89 bacterium B3_LCP]|uniref:Uncharacterized protein n=1 Tax=candidate division LCP-89 bacterium B3_LCP TaxID=2012998 RepID=A0A532V5P8_UNCL8|nr:MAG: hypothetical protein CEE37_02225 [candidate division LCP-89 bacterium B3_LCP]
MKIALFLGSGVSKETGLPMSDGITKSLLYDDWHNYTGSIYMPGPPPDVTFRMRNCVPLIQKYLRFLKDYSDRYYTQWNRSEANYEDLFFLTKQVQDEGIETENPAIASFYNEIKKELDFWCKGKTQQQINIKRISFDACNFIQNVIHSKLYTSIEPKGMQLISDLVDLSVNYKISSLDIFTLNHDLLIEKLLTKNKIWFKDGFERSENPIRYFKRNWRLDTPERVRLIKLHGSINWFRIKQYEDNLWNENIWDKDVFHTDKYCSYRNIDQIEFRRHLPNNETSHLIPELITGTDNKHLSYTFGLISEMHRRFHDSLKSTKKIIMSGYGWNDRGINARLREWIHSSRSNQLYLLHKDPDRIRDYSKLGRSHFDRLKEYNKLVIVRKYLKDATLLDIRECIE